MTGAGLKTVRRVALVAAASALYAINLTTFVKAAGILPGGVTGVSLLLKELAGRLARLDIPFSLPYYVLNAVPAYICFRYVGKWFTILSCLCVFITGCITDLMPLSLLSYLQLDDPLLCAVFGGLLNGAATALCLSAGATSGGTDFIAIYFSEKRSRDTWNYILAGNCVLLVAAGVVWTPQEALYSIIFQWVGTMTVTRLYTNYQQKTLFIITDKPDAVYALIREKTHHAATAFTGIGQYQHCARTMLYSVVSADDVRPLVAEIKKVDENAFVNVLKTDRLNGKFFRRPKD